MSGFAAAPIPTGSDISLGPASEEGTRRSEAEVPKSETRKRK
jgi:hypothetical protein